MSYKIVFLGTYPEYVNTLAERTFDTWKIYNPSLTLEKCIEDYKDKLNTDKLPFCLMIMSCTKAAVYGSVTLDTILPNELFPGIEESSEWIGDFQGIDDPCARAPLMRALAGVSKNLGIETLYVYTSDPCRVDYYLELGWKIFTTCQYLDHLVTVMEYKIDDENTK